MKIIGHRGAAGLAPENTTQAVQAGLAAGVDAIEVDVRITSDHHLVLSHDASLERTHGIDLKVHKASHKEVKKVRSAKGHHVPSLQEVLLLTGDTAVFIEGKNGNWAKALYKILSKESATERISVISFNHQALSEFRTLCPHVKTYVLEHRNPFDAINAARIYGFDGIDINYWTLNPLSYWLAKRHKLDIVVFTVNKPWVASFLRLLYPRIAITTDVPQKMQFLRPKPKRKPRRNHGLSLRS